MTRHHQVIPARLVCAVALLLSLSAWAQTSFPITGGTESDLLGDPVFIKAMAYKESSRYLEAADEFRLVAGKHYGTELEATALFQVANCLHLQAGSERPLGDLDLAAQLDAQSRAQFQEIVQRFPNTKYWFRARSRLRPNQSKEEFEALVVEVGGSPYEEIRSGRVTQIRGDRIPIQFREFIWRSYTGMGETTEEKERFLKFVRYSFPEESYTLLRDLYRPDEGFNDFLDTTPPQVEISSPLEGSVVAPGQAILRAEMHDGDLMARQINLADSVVEIDGQNVLSTCELSSDIDPEGPVFERLQVTYTPPVPLALGPHTYRILAMERIGERQTELIVRFTVASTPPSPTTETRSSIKDALVYEKSPHSNEGANPILTLEKINGKAARNLLGFDLAGVNTNSLTSATLVLSINPSDQVTGWGNGETVTVKPVTVAWQEGNGKKHGLPGNQQSAGSGAGTTWFSPTDENISNGSANAVVQWSGGGTYATTGTAPSLTVHNHQTGELRFDVTDDVLNGVAHGWLLRKDAENKGSKVSFYSREGGGANLGPRLLLEYGGQTGMSAPQQFYSVVAGFFGFTTHPVSLQASSGMSEGPVIFTAEDKLRGKVDLSNPSETPCRVSEL